METKINFFGRFRNMAKFNNVCQKNNVHLALINARLTRKTFKRWKLVPKTTQLIFNSINLFLCSNLETKNFLDKLKINNVVYTGNLKLINQFQESFNTRNSDSFFKNKFWLAVSTHRGEEEICLNVHLKLKKEVQKFNYSFGSKTYYKSKRD